MKKLVALFLAFAMMLSLAPSVFAVSDEANEAADTLYELGLFGGVGTNADGTINFDLDRTPTRAEAVTMLVRLLGKEEEAKAGIWQTPFTDIAEWAKSYIGYAYVNNLTNGVGSDGKGGQLFGGNITVNATQYLTFVLRALGYSSDSDFQWDKAWELSDQLGITSGQFDDSSTTLTRGDMAIISLLALSAKLKDSDSTLAEFLGINLKGNTVPKTEKIALTGANYGFVRINGKLYQIVYSYEAKRQEYIIGEYVQYDKNEPNNVYLNVCSSGSFMDTIFLALLTNTYKTTTPENPYVDGAIDMFETFYKSDTIKVDSKMEYTSATSVDFIWTHSYKDKTLTVPTEISDGGNMSDITVIDGIKYCGQFASVYDYCAYFGLKVYVKDQYDGTVQQHILVIDY